MHLKLFVSFLVLGYCAATIIGEKYITVNHDGSYVQVTGDNGMKIKIVKNRLGGLHGLKNYDFILIGHDYYKNVHIEDQVGGDVVFDLFAQFQGVIDDVTFEKLLYKLETLVHQGDVHPKIFHLFQCLINPEHVKYLDFKDITGVGAYKMNERLYGDNLYNKRFYEDSMYQDKYGMGHIYGQYTPSFWHQIAYKQQMPYFTGVHTPSMWSQMWYKRQMPFYYGGEYQGINRGVNQYLWNNMENQVEREVEREVEQEVENKLATTHYGQVTPFHYGLFNKEVTPFRYGLFNKEVAPFHYGLFNKEATPFHYGLYNKEVTPFRYGLYNKYNMYNMYPKTSYGMDRYGYNNAYFGNYHNTLTGNTMYHGYTPMNNYYNMWMGYHRMPMTTVY